MSKSSKRAKTTTSSKADDSKEAKEAPEDYDSEEDDSDYDPNADEDGDEGNGLEDGEGEEAVVVELSVGRRRKADELWKSMVEEDNTSVAEIMAKAVSTITSRKSSKMKDEDSSRRAKSAIRKESIIAQIFGKKAARKIIYGAHVRKSPDFDASLGVVSSSDNNSSNRSKSSKINDDEIRDRIKESVKKVMKKTTVLETKKFAGKEIQVEKVVYEGADLDNASKGGSSSSNSNSNSNSGKAASKGLDSVLDSIKGPKTISTVSKSSMDWEVYKDKEGLEDDLAKASKEGYLTRKDFLERCDYRSFEMEREVRLKEQAARGSAVP